MKNARLLIALSCAVAPACASSDLTEDPSTDQAAVAATVASPTPVYATPTDDTATSLAVRNGMTVTLHTVLRWHTGTGEELILQGSTSQDLTAVWGFIPDDSFGTPTQLGPRSFELVFDNASDINTVISGSPFYLKLSTAAGDWSAQVLVAPRVIPTGTTTTRLAIGAALNPIQVTTNPLGVVFRGTLSTTAVPQAIGVTATSPATLVKDGAHAWHFDWEFSPFESVATGGDLTATATFGATTSTRAGTIEMRVAKLGLAAGNSPDDIYGLPSCDAAVLACLRTLPADTTDFGACGAFLATTVCTNENGFPIP